MVDELVLEPGRAPAPVLVQVVDKVAGHVLAAAVALALVQLLMNESTIDDVIPSAEQSAFAWQGCLSLLTRV